jgi:hypothetical protein
MLKVDKKEQAEAYEALNLITLSAEERRAAASLCESENKKALFNYRLKHNKTLLLKNWMKFFVCLIELISLRKNKIQLSELFHKISYSEVSFNLIIISRSFLL